jgi:hypothetical protein
MMSHTGILRMPNFRNSIRCTVAYGDKAIGRGLRSMAVLLAVCFIMFAIEPTRAVAQPTIFFEKHGLDPAGNPIDRLLYIFGSGCVMFVRERTGNPCRIEKELSLFIHTLPHDAHSFSHALIALGATCDAESTQSIPVICVYQRRVQTAALVAGDPDPRAIAYDDFTIRVTAKLQDGVLRARIAFDRTWEKVK